MTSNNRAVVVTGASGFLSAWILPKLIARGRKVVAIDIARDETRLRQATQGQPPPGIAWETADLTADGIMSRIAEQYAADTILHLAALQIPACKANPIAGAKVNVVGHVGVLEAARHVGARVVYTSSVAAKPRGAAGLPHEAAPCSKLESGRRWPAADLAEAERRAEQMLAARSFRAPAVDSRAMSAV